MFKSGRARIWSHMVGSALKRRFGVKQILFSHEFMLQLQRCASWTGYHCWDVIVLFRVESYFFDLRIGLCFTFRRLSSEVDLASTARIEGRPMKHPGTSNFLDIPAWNKTYCHGSVFRIIIVCVQHCFPAPRILSLAFAWEFMFHRAELQYRAFPEGATK